MTTKHIDTVVFPEQVKAKLPGRDRPTLGVVVNWQVHVPDLSIFLSKVTNVFGPADRQVRGDPGLQVVISSARRQLGAQTC